MIEEDSNQNSKQSSQQSSDADPKSAAEPSADKPVSNPNEPSPQIQPKQSRKLLVEIVKDDELKPFERETLELARQTLGLSRSQTRLTIWAIVIAAIAAAFVWAQLKQMTWNNQILASQSESAVAGAIESERNTRAQIKVAQDQATAAQESVKAIQKQMRQDQRAWMHFSETKITMTANAQGEVDVTVPLTMFATGKTPAKKVRMEFAMEIVKNEQNGITGFPYAYIPRLQDTTGIIVPGEPQSTFTVHLLKGIKGTQLAETRLLSVNEYQDLVKGKTFLIVYGRIRYRDIFNIPHETRYCHFLSPSGKDAYASRCTEYNGIDDN